MSGSSGSARFRNYPELSEPVPRFQIAIWEPGTRGATGSSGQQAAERAANRGYRHAAFSASRASNGRAPLSDHLIRRQVDEAQFTGVFARRAADCHTGCHRRRKSRREGCLRDFIQGGHDAA